MKVQSVRFTLPRLSAHKSLALIAPSKSKTCVVFIIRTQPAQDKRRPVVLVRSFILASLKHVGFLNRKGLTDMIS
jgi:hypothetical protein